MIWNSRNTSKRLPGLRSLALAAVALVALAGPVGADYTRSCNAELVFDPRGDEVPTLTYNFSVARTVDLYAQVNRARREARARIIDCVRDHWAERAMDSRPRACRDAFRYEMRNYPFNALSKELTEAICAEAPPGGQVRIDVDLYITGNRGCVESDANMDPHDHFTIARDHPVQCVAIFVPGLILDITEPEGEDEPPGTEPEPEPEPEPGDDPPPADPVRFNVLPMFRLPGNDLSRIGLPGPGWQQCRDLCRDNAACAAFTYRGPTAASVPVCLLKRSASVPVPDACCVSGIRE